VSDDALGHNPLEESVDSIWKVPKKKPQVIAPSNKESGSVMHPPADTPVETVAPQPSSDEWLPIDNADDEDDGVFNFQDGASIMSGEVTGIRDDEEADSKSIGKTIQLVGFRLGEELFGIDIMSVQEIIKIVDVTRVPKTAGYVMGVVNLRGEVIPVLRLKDRFNLNYQTFKTGKQRIIIANANVGTIGFEVDEVTEIFRIPESIIVPPPPSSISLDEKLITGVGRLEEQLLVILDVDNLLASTKMVV